jgi:hypothetical protein
MSISGGQKKFILYFYQNNYKQKSFIFLCFSFINVLFPKFFKN